MPKKWSTAIQRNATQREKMQRNVTTRYAIQCNAVQYNVRQRTATRSIAMQHNTTQCNVMQSNNRFRNSWIYTPELFEILKIMILIVQIRYENSKSSGNRPSLEALIRTEFTFRLFLTCFNFVAMGVPDVTEH